MSAAEKSQRILVANSNEKLTISERQQILRGLMLLKAEHWTPTNLAGFAAA
jgi:hypothetical protein